MFISLEEIKKGKSLKKVRHEFCRINLDAYIKGRVGFIKKIDKRLTRWQSKIDYAKGLLIKDEKLLTSKEREYICDLIYRGYELEDELSSNELFDLREAFIKSYENNRKGFAELVAGEDDATLVDLKDAGQREIDRLNIHKRGDYDLVVAVKDTLFSDFEVIKDLGKQISSEGKDYYIVVTRNPNIKSVDRPAEYIYTQEQLEKLTKLNNHLIENGRSKGIYFYEVKEPTIIDGIQDCWSLDQVKKANNELDNVIDDIKKYNLTPFETMIFIYDYLLLNFTYKDDHQDFEATRVIPSIFNGDGIVCSGYSSLLKAAVDKIADENLTCKFLNPSIMGFDIYNNIKQEGHSQTLVKIKDETYGINGFYINDPSWDAAIKDEELSSLSYANFMVPVEAMQSLTNGVYVQKHNKDRFNELIVDLEGDKIMHLPKNIQKIAFRIAYGNEYYQSQVVKKHKRESEIIPVDKLKKALTNVYSKVYADTLSQEEITNLVEQRIEKSFDAAKCIYQPGAKHTFAPTAPKEEQELNR